MPPTDKLTILFLAANPDDTRQLKLDEEMRAIDDVLRVSEYRERFDLRSHWAVRFGDLQELLLRYQPHIVHFSGHGSDRGEILLKEAGGPSQRVAPEALAALFTILQDNIRCVLLNACYTEIQAQGIAGAIDFVVGMERAIPDSAAIAFAAGFYLGLGYGRSIKTAFDLGCNRIDPAGRGEIHRAARPPAAAAGPAPGVSTAAIPKLIALRSDPAQAMLIRSAPAAETAAAAPSGGSSPRQAAAPAPAAAGKLTKLTGQQFGQLQRALLAAFDMAALTQMVQFELGENLEAIAGGSNLSMVVFNLISWAQRFNKLDMLLDGALAQVPDNVELRAVDRALRR